MFAILAFLSFLLALFDADLGNINFVELGLLFVAAHLVAWGFWPAIAVRQHRRE